MTRKRFGTESALELAGCAKDAAGLARLLAKAPLRARKPVEPCDIGLFADRDASFDLVDLAHGFGGKR